MAQKLKRKVPRANYISKLSKSSGKRHKPSNFNPEFYDRLSKIWLTPRALRELDRRNESLPLSKPKPTARLEKPCRAKLVALAKFGFSELAQFAAFGGPDLSDLKGVCAYMYLLPANTKLQTNRPAQYPEPPIITQQTQPTKEMPATSENISISVSADGFREYCIDHCVYPPGHKLPDDTSLPELKNIAEICKSLEKPRASISPSAVSETAYENLLERMKNASKWDILQ